MSQVRCGDPETLVAYLYEECDPDEQRAIEAHIARCSDCAEEIEALRGTRVQLAAWTPPETTLDFHIVSERESPRSRVIRPVPWWRQPMPAWAQAAAAVTIFGVGLSMGITRGRLSQPGAASGGGVTQPVASIAGTGAAVTQLDLINLEKRLRAEMSQVRSASTVAPVSASAAAASPAEAQILARVRAMIQDSEQRQQRELALRSAELVRDFDTQRRVDLSRIERTFGQIEGNTGAEVAQQRQMLNYLMRVSEPGR